MKKNKSKASQGWITALLCFQIGISVPIPEVHPIVAHATATSDAQNETCNPIYDQQNNQADQSIVVPGKADCDIAEQARKAKAQATTKAVIFGTLAGVCAAMAIFEQFGSGSACTAMSTAATALAAAWDMFLQQTIQDESKATSKQIRSMTTSLVGMYTAAKMGVLGKEIQGYASKIGGSSSSKSGSCISSSIMLGISMGLAIWEAADAKFIQKKKIEDAKNAVYVANQTRQIRDSNYGGSTTGGMVNNAPNSAGGGSGGGGGADPCLSAPGNSYLTCTFQGTPSAPAISALITDQKVNDLIGKLTHGKTLGDLAKGFKGDASGSAIGNYVGEALGAPAHFSQSLGKHFEAVAKVVGDSRGSMPGAVYASKGKSDSGSKTDSAEMNFNKMMEGLLKQMNPDESASGANKQNASEAVFRKLDLLPADKIESNKDISLFVRIGYRYRKVSPTLNQASQKEVNQSGP